MGAAEQDIFKWARNLPAEYIGDPGRKAWIQEEEEEGKDTNQLWYDTVWLNSKQLKALESRDGRETQQEDWHTSLSCQSILEKSGM